MRIYKDLDYVEQLGSGVLRIPEYYGEESFHFSRNFLRMILPSSEQATPQILNLLKILKGKQSRTELQEVLNLKDREYFRKYYLKPAMDAGFVGLTIPDKPRSSKQEYHFTEKGKAVISDLEKDKRD